MVVVLNQVDTAEPVRGRRVRRRPAPAARRRRAASLAVAHAVGPHGAGLDDATRPARGRGRRAEPQRPARRRRRGRRRRARAGGVARRRRRGSPRRSAASSSRRSRPSAGRAGRRRGRRASRGGGGRRAARLAADAVGPTAAPRPAAPAAPARRDDRREVRSALVRSSVPGADAGAAGAGRDRRAPGLRRPSRPTCRRRGSRRSARAAVRRSDDVRRRASTRPSSAPTSGSTGRRCGGGAGSPCSGCSPLAALVGAAVAARAGVRLPTCGCRTRRRPTSVVSRCRRCCSWVASLLGLLLALLGRALVSGRSGGPAQAGRVAAARRRSSRSPTSWCSARSMRSSAGMPGPGWRWTGRAPAERSSAALGRDGERATRTGLLSTALRGWLARPQIACRPCRCGSGCRIVGTGAATGRRSGHEETVMNETMVTVVGHVANEPTLRMTTSGTHVTSFRLACDRATLRQGPRRLAGRRHHLLRVTCWRTIAENVADSLVKGQPVVVHGRLSRSGPTTTRTASRRSSLEIDAFAVGHDLTRGSRSSPRHPVCADPRTTSPRRPCGRWPPTSRTTTTTTRRSLLSR